MLLRRAGLTASAGLSCLFCISMRSTEFQFRVQAAILTAAILTTAVLTKSVSTVTPGRFIILGQAG